METFCLHKAAIALLPLFILFLVMPAFSQRISELPPASYIGIGDLLPIVQNGVTKKLPYSGLINSFHFYSDSIFVKYRCHKIKGESRWYFSGDTIYIDTCFVAGTATLDTCLFDLYGDTVIIKGDYKAFFTNSVYLNGYAIPMLDQGDPLAGFLTLKKLGPGSNRQLGLASVRNVADSIFIDPPDLLIRDPFISTDSTAKGIACRQIAGEKLVFGELCFLKSDGKVYRADADSVIYLPGLFLVAEKAGASANDTAIFLEDGYIRCDARWAWATKGAVLYASGALGGLTDSAPTGSNDGIQTVGVVETTDIVKFRPDLLIIELK
jgi:hypothetical protein